MADDYAARLRAIAKVTEPAFFFLDEDDSYQAMEYLPATMKIGLEHHVNKLSGYNVVRTCSNYSLAKHLDMPQLVHNSWVVNTAKAREVLATMPVSGEYYFQHMFTYLFIKRFGFEHEPRLSYRWEIAPTGYHRHAATAIRNTLAYLKTLERK